MLHYARGESGTLIENMVTGERITLDREQLAWFRTMIDHNSAVESACRPRDGTSALSVKRGGGTGWTRFVAPILTGALSAAAWTWWTQAVSDRRPVETAVSELVLIAICRFSWQWYFDERHCEWWVYAVTSAMASGLVVWLGS